MHIIFCRNMCSEDIYSFISKKTIIFIFTAAGIINDRYFA